MGLGSLTAYRVKERPSSVTEILQELGIEKKVSNPINNSGVYSFKAEELKAEHLVSIPFEIPISKEKASSKSNNVSDDFKEIFDDFFGSFNK